MRKLAIVVCLLLTVSFLADAKIVFMSNRGDGETYHIYVMDDDGSNVERITDTPFHDTQPSWSPDSLHIAFARRGKDWQTSDVFVMNRNGTAAENITDHPSLDGSPRWAPDGGSIAFVSTRDDDFNIYTVDLLTGEVKRLTGEDKEFEEGAHNPDFSPDGRHIVYTQTIPRLWRGLYTMRANGARKKEFIRADGVLRYDPRWSSDGSRILYGEAFYGPGADIELVANRIVISGWEYRTRRVLNTPRNWLSHSLSWAGPNAVLIAAEEYGVRDGQVDIYRYDLSTHTITNLTNSPGDDYGQDWIPDRIYDVAPASKIATLWGALKKND